jgi:hypothetical protein
MDNISKNILIGSVLGDGWLDKPTRNGSHWTIKYDEKSLSYLEWLHSKVSTLFPKGIRKKPKYHQYFIYSEVSLEIAEFRRVFYPEGKKIVPKNIKNLLTDPLSLAVWYMDDGSLDKRDKYHLNATIATFCFSYKDCELLAKALKDNFGVEAHVHKSTMRQKIGYRLYIVSKSMGRFMQIIQPFIQPCFRYKLVL